jgi:hypothetical protein
MAYDDLLAEEVRRALSGFQYIEKKMFGGIGFMVNGSLCVSLNDRPDHIMMVRIDPNNLEALKRIGAKIAVMRGRQMPGWVFLTKDAVKTQQGFNYWVQLALDFNKNHKKK